MIECAICQQQFVLVKSLHAHLKAHKIKVGDYYTTHFPRFDCHSGSPISFKNRIQYLEAKFNTTANMNRWLEYADKEDAQEFLQDSLFIRLAEKESGIFPPALYLKLAKLPSRDAFDKAFGSTQKFAEDSGLDWFLNKDLPKDFWDIPTPDLEILIDTREQKPLKFDRSFSQKLDFGDYTCREKYSKTFIERKSASDFASTMLSGHKRFHRELERCKEFNSYIFVLIESTPDKLYPSLVHKPKNMEYLWHNAKDLMLEFPHNFQFCFSGNRAGSQFLIPRIFHFGQDLWNVDLNYYLTKKIKEDVLG